MITIMTTGLRANGIAPSTGIARRPRVSTSTGAMGTAPLRRLRLRMTMVRGLIRHPRRLRLRGPAGMTMAIMSTGITTLTTGGTITGTRTRRTSTRRTLPRR